MKTFTSFAAIAFVAANMLFSATASAQEPASGCPFIGWGESLMRHQSPTAAFPVTETTNTLAPDCNFHQWSWEAFAWATAPDSNGVPRFLNLPNTDDLLRANLAHGRPVNRPLRVGSRSTKAHNSTDHHEGAGGFVEADGNVLIGPNGYPVYNSIHMNWSYFNTAKKNLIIDGGYKNQPPTSYFEVGAGVFKAMWLRLDPGQSPPEGAYTTLAEVPVLESVNNPNGTVTIRQKPGQFAIATVALVGMHVVGYTVGHPEMVWATFEHPNNSPRVPDNTFSGAGSDPKDYTFYRANTPFSAANQAMTPPQLSFNETTQKFSTVTTVVLKNATGGENQPHGVGNIAAVSEQAKSIMKGVMKSIFGNYVLNGTVWLPPNSYSMLSNQADALGSVNLTNSVGETYIQVDKNAPMSGVNNCFSCHNATSYSYQSNPPPLANRQIGISHVLGVGTPYMVPNEITGTK